MYEIYVAQWDYIVLLLTDRFQYHTVDSNDSPPSAGSHSQILDKVTL